MASHARRPNADGMTPVAVITGTPAVGKSTVCRQLAQRLPIAAHIEADRLQQFIVAGGQWPSAATAAAIEQLILRTRNAASIARNFLAAGIPTLIDDVLCTDEQMAVLAEQMPHARLVVLAARADVVLERDAMRHKHTAANYKDVADEIANVVGANATWVDTNGLTPDQTISAVWNAVFATT
jgi:adenylate kinase family enzyme